MKISPLTNPIHPALFQIAARMEIPSLPRLFKSAPKISKIMFPTLWPETKKPGCLEKTENDAAQKTPGRPASIKTVEFHLKAPAASSVKLAADFTDWEKFPLDLIKSEDGIWYTAVPLPPGQYSYRFIVDDEWRDDPRSSRRLPGNSSGRANAVMVEAA